MPRNVADYPETIRIVSGYYQLIGLLSERAIRPILRNPALIVNGDGALPNPDPPPRTTIEKLKLGYIWQP
jgi:hypothetical protein